MHYFTIRQYPYGDLYNDQTDGDLHNDHTKIFKFSYGNI